MQPLLPIVVGFVTFVASGEPPQDPKLMEVSVTVRVIDHEQNPIEDVPLIVHSILQPAFAFTDAAGEAELTLLTLPDEQIVTAVISAGGGTPVVPPEHRKHAIDRFHVIRTGYAFRDYYVLPLDEQILVHVIQADESVIVGGRLVAPNGKEPAQPISGSIAVRGALADVLVRDDTERFRIRVRKGTAAELWIIIEQGQVHWIQIPAELLQGNLGLGDIPLANTPVSAGLGIEFTTYEDLFFLEDKHDLAHAVTLVESVTAELHVFPMRWGTPPVAFWDPPVGAPAIGSERVPLPPGEYYIVPGDHFDIPGSTLLDSVRAQKHEALDTAGVPKIELAPLESAEITIDAHAAVQAIMSAAGDGRAVFRRPRRVDK
jgi:hypothetical protein